MKHHKKMMNGNSYYYDQPFFSIGINTYKRIGKITYCWSQVVVILHLLLFYVAQKIMLPFSILTQY